MHESFLHPRRADFTAALDLAAVQLVVELAHDAPAAALRGVEGTTEAVARFGVRLEGPVGVWEPDPGYYIYVSRSPYRYATRLAGWLQQIVERGCDVPQVRRALAQHRPRSARGVGALVHYGVARLLSPDADDLLRRLHRCTCCGRLFFDARFGKGRRRERECSRHCTETYTRWRLYHPRAKTKDKAGKPDLPWSVERWRTVALEQLRTGRAGVGGRPRGGKPPRFPIRSRRSKSTR